MLWFPIVVALIHPTLGAIVNSVSPEFFSHFRIIQLDYRDRDGKRSENLGGQVVSNAARLLFCQNLRRGGGVPASAINGSLKASFDLHIYFWISRNRTLRKPHVPFLLIGLLDLCQCCCCIESVGILPSKLIFGLALVGLLFSNWFQS